MPKIEEQILRAKERLKQLEAKQTKSVARQRTIAARRQRQADLRRKILVGAIVLEAVDKGELTREQVWRWLDKGLTRKEDRELFDGWDHRAQGAEQDQRAGSAGNSA